MDDVKKCTGTLSAASWGRCEKPHGHPPPCTHDPMPRTPPPTDLERLIEKIETIVPYVTATINPRGGNVFQVGRLIGANDPENCKDWVAVHAGRAGSSTNQLEHLLKMAREMKGRL